MSDNEHLTAAAAVTVVNYRLEMSVGIVSKAVTVRPSGINKLSQCEMSLNQRAFRLCIITRRGPDNVEKNNPRSPTSWKFPRTTEDPGVGGRRDATGCSNKGPIISNDNLIVTQVVIYSLNQRQTT